MIFETPKGKVAFTPGCLDTFVSHRQSGYFQRETGGQLFAEISGDEFLIRKATIVPGKQTRMSFRPNREAEQVEIQAQFSAGLHYVGDWHTHPENHPTPSLPDIEKLTSIFRKSTHQLPFMLMVIVGLEEFPQGLFVGAVASEGVSQLMSR